MNVCVCVLVSEKDGQTERNLPGRKGPCYIHVHCGMQSKADFVEVRDLTLNYTKIKLLRGG